MINPAIVYSFSPGGVTGFGQIGLAEAVDSSKSNTFVCRYSRRAVPQNGAVIICCAICRIANVIGGKNDTFQSLRFRSSFHRVVFAPAIPVRLPQIPLVEDEFRL
ncbi:MAG: hypothetical protein ACYTXI_40380 [Nostoc sp.]